MSRACMLAALPVCGVCGEEFAPICLDDLALLGDEAAMAELSAMAQRSSLAREAANRGVAKRAGQRDRAKMTDEERREYVRLLFTTGQRSTNGRDLETCVREAVDDLPF